MANDEHVAILKKGVAAWNTWRDGLAKADLLKTDLMGAELSGTDLRGANLSLANLSHALLNGANLSGANLQGAYLGAARLLKADLRKANLYGADLRETYLFQANLSRANLFHANLLQADLTLAKLRGANLSQADLPLATLDSANLSKANLSGANLKGATLVDTDLTGADLTGCRIYGVSAWGLKLGKTKQQNLVITREEEPAVTVDNIEVAQFIYLMLNNQKVRDVIDTVTSKVALILGRFTKERKVVLDALREELRKRNYLPILFDFEAPVRQNFTETITLLARMARFIIADLTEPSSIPQELQAIIPSVRVPVQPLLLEGSSLYSMFKDFDPRDFHWVLPVYEYKKPKQLLAALAKNVIAPAEGKAKEFEERRRQAEPTKPLVAAKKGTPSQAPRPAGRPRRRA